MLIAFVGIDGVGKSTQVNLFADWLGRTSSAAVHKVKIAGLNDMVLKELARKLFGDPYAYHPGIPTAVRAVGCCLDVVAHYLTSAKPLLEAGEHVIYDRYIYCQEAYFRAYGTDMEWPMKILGQAQTADQAFLLDLPAEEAYRRLHGREAPPNLQENIAMLTRVREEYLALASKYPEISVIDASLPVMEMHSQITRTFARHLEQQ